MTRLHDALQDLAGNAPPIDLTTRVVARAHRRRRARLLTIPAVVIAVASATVAGSLLGTPGLAGQRASARHETTSSDGLPHPLPARRDEPAKFAYLDWCRRPSGPDAKPVSGACAQWRVVGRSGRQWRVTDGVGTFPGHAGTTMNGFAPLEISEDGRRIAYYRSTDEHFVVRNLTTGLVTVVDRRVPMSYLEQYGAELMFSSDGQRLAVSFSTDRRGHAMLADTASGVVHSLPGSWVIGLGAGNSPVTLAEDGAGDATTLLLAGPDGALHARVPLDPTVHLDGPGNMIAPDGHTLLARPGAQKSEGLIEPKPLDSVTLVDVRTGKAVGTRRLHLPAKASEMMMLRGWAGSSAIVLTADDPAYAGQVYLADLDTGQSRVFGTIDTHSDQSETVFGGYAP